VGLSYRPLRAHPACDELDHLLDMRVICMDISIGRRGLSSVEIGVPACLSSTCA
jgi:hypothetical protein